MNLATVSQILTLSSEPDYRLRQISQNYYSGRFVSFEQMTDLPKILREKLISVPLLSVVEKKLSVTGSTQKALLELADGLAIESVLMDYDNWLTVCVSCQVGCPLGCRFCATGKMGFKRHLTPEEIIDQILYWDARLYPRYVGRVVFMGMGEPFLNYENVLAAIDILNNKLKIGHRKISLSTAGIVPQIKAFADQNTQINLAVSLHSTLADTRLRLMPITKTYSLDDLKAACLYYVKKTRRQLFFEYALIDGINDTPSAISSLINWLKSDYLFYLNLIPLNPAGGSLTPSSAKRQKEIEQLLTKNHVQFSVRRSFGPTINAACGQLAVNNAT